MGRLKHIGILGGTFDPPHLGHLILAEHAREQIPLDEVLWVPAGNPPHKQDLIISSVAHRVEMVRCSIQENAHFRLSLVDVERSGPHYTVDMLKLLTNQNPGAELYFLIGGDSLRDLPKWHQPERILSQAKLVVMTRPSIDYDLDALEHILPDIQNRLLFLDTPLIDISGKIIREQAQSGRSFRYLVLDRVCEYILQHGLYQNESLE